VLLACSPSLVSLVPLSLDLLFINVVPPGSAVKPKLLKLTRKMSKLFFILRLISCVTAVHYRRLDHTQCRPSRVLLIYLDLRGREQFTCIWIRLLIAGIASCSDGSFHIAGQYNALNH
jgi:hypothetical protein